MNQFILSMTTVFLPFAVKLHRPLLKAILLLPSRILPERIPGRGSTGWFCRHIGLFESGLMWSLLQGLGLSFFLSVLQTAGQPSCVFGKHGEGGVPDADGPHAVSGGRLVSGAMAASCPAISQSRISRKTFLIFVTVGTWKNGYDRLIRAVDELAKEGKIAGPILAQVGHGHYQPQCMEYFDFCSPQEFEEWIRKAHLVISHAGVGSIASAIRQGKPIVVLPRQLRFGEVDNDHQMVTAKYLEKEGKILAAYEESQLLEKILEAQNFTPAPCESGERLLLFLDTCFEAILAQKNARKGLLKKIWPYYILRREEENLRNDLCILVEHFRKKNIDFDGVVFVPQAGLYLGRLFRQEYGSRWPCYFFTVRRPSTLAPTGRLKEYVFQHRWLADIMRHVEVLIRLVKMAGGVGRRRIMQHTFPDDVRGKKLLVIDDSVDTGATLRHVRETLLQKGAESVMTSCISNHLRPSKVWVDYAVYYYALLRTPNSRDYDAR